MDFRKSRTSVACTLFALLAGSPFPGFCQGSESPDGERAVRSIGLSVGAGDFNQRDRYLSPYIFGGTVFASSLSYRVKTATSAQRIEAFISAGGLNSDMQPRDVYQDVGLLSYSYVHTFGRWTAWNNPLLFFAGGGISSLVMNTDFNTVDNMYGTVLYDESWYWHNSLNLVLAADYLPGRGKSLSVRLTVPLVGLVSRPKNGHWFNADNSDVMRNFGNAILQGNFEPLWKAPVVLAAFEYVHGLTEHLNFRGTYSFGYASSGRPAEILSMGMYMNNLLAGIEWVF